MVKTREELIAEVLRLDAERTQGEWSSGFNGTCFQVDAEMDAVCTTQFCYANESKQNAQFIALAPDMARIIRDQQKQIEMLVEALEHYVGVVQSYNDPIDFSPMVIDGGWPARIALTRIKSGGCME